ncbi:DUF4197 domain-containing protein [Flavobacterium urocaniciphilum]|nr:DUF4197 domain-containing protein [Flavobacterium urocaniciphilum]
MKKIILLLVCLPFLGNAQLKDVIKKTAAKATTKNIAVSNLEIANGLKEALDNGVKKQVTKLTAVDGFYKNELVKILLPEELKKVDSKLRMIGLGSLADEGILMLNRAAEDAVKQSTPIFIDAIKNMNFTDAKNILLGSENAATTYLQTTTNSALYEKFSPVIKASLANVGADAVWKKIIDKYNSIPLVTKVNPDLTDYTTNKALEGVFKMITIEEKNIRSGLDSRTSALLKKVFALQDKKK